MLESDVTGAHVSGLNSLVPTVSVFIFLNLKVRGKSDLGNAVPSRRWSFVQNRRGVPSSRRGGARGGEHLCPLGWVPACGHSSGPRVVAHGPSQLAWNSPPGVTPLFAAGPAAGRPAPTGPGSSASDALLPAVTLLLPPRCPGGPTYSFLPRTPTR